MSDPGVLDFSQLCAAAERVQKVWLEQGLDFCFIGGLAVIHWGEARMTQDIDASVATAYGQERTVIGRLLEALTPRIADADRFAEMHRVLLVQEPGGVPMDVSLAALPFELEVIRRAQWIELQPSIRIRLCTASDLVILKAFADRTIDWQDIRGIIIRNNRNLDWPRIESDLRMLAELKEEPEIVDRLVALRHQLQNRL